MNRIKSAKQQSIDGILFLQGVFKKDCKRVEDFFHERLLHDTSAENKMYDKIPLVFTGINNWIKSTNLLCWNCSRCFKGRPWFEPQSIDPLNHKAKTNDNPAENNGRDKTTDTKLNDNPAENKGCDKTTDNKLNTSHSIKYINKHNKQSTGNTPTTKHEYCINIKGNFCSPNCVMRYILTNTRDMAERHNKTAMLKFVYELFTGVFIHDICPSPPHSDMIQYGGHMSVIDYQKKIEELGSNYMKLEDANFINNCKLFIPKFME